MALFLPSTLDELREVMRQAGQSGQPLNLFGRSSKCRMAGAIEPAPAEISTASLNRVLEYEPRDLTISVEAGIPYAEVSRVLAENNQYLPLDPPFEAQASIGGILAANTCGPRRRMYGAPRDVLIGMKYVTLAGHLIQSGGMVVKNVAGLDTAKLMVGSFGTLAAIAVANFRVYPKPPSARTFVLSFERAQEALAARDRLLNSVLQPIALDLLNPPAAARLGLAGHALLVEAAGTENVIRRWKRELPDARELEGAAAEELWRGVRDFTPRFLADYPQAAVARISSTLTGMVDVLRKTQLPAVARAGTGTCYLYGEPDALPAFRGVVEFAPEAVRREMELWPDPGGDLELMSEIKRLFDPRGILNRGRLYGRI